MAEHDVGDEQPPHEARSLRGTTFRGARFALAGYVLSNGIMFGIYLVLARLISPAGFGQYAAASIIVGVSSLFAEGGMMSAIIQRPDRVEEAASTAFYSLLLGGTLLSLAALAASPVLGLFFRNLHVTGMAAALSAGMLLRSLTVVPDALLQRRFSFARRVAVDPLSSLAFAVASIIACAYGAGAWGLVAGSYASLITQVILAWAFVRFRPRRRLASIGMWRELTSFGRHVMGSEVLLRIGTQLDALSLGRFAGAAPLGQYRNGLRLAQQPGNTFVSVAAYVLLPALARMAHDAQRLAWAAQRVLRMVAVAAIPVSFSLLPLGEPAAILLLGHTWREAGHVIAALFPIIWAGSTISACSEMFKAVGRPQILVHLWLVSFCSLLILMPVTAITLGAVGVAAGVSASQMLTAIYSLWRVSPLIEMSWRALGRALAAPAIAGAAMALAMFGFSAAVDPLAHAPVVKFALTGVELVVGAVLYCSVLLLLDGPRRRSTLQFVAALRARRGTLARAR